MRSLIWLLLWLALAAAGATVACQHEPDPVGAQMDASPAKQDSGANDGDAGPNPGLDAGPADGGIDAGDDAGMDAGYDAGYDAGHDAS
jgi:hypothetical protein